MSLLELQSLMARLVTKQDLLEHFLDDPEQVVKSQGFDAKAARALATILALQLRHYSKSLVNKRCCEAVRCLPLTCRVLGRARFFELFRRHAAQSTMQGLTRYQDDAIAFARTLRSDPPLLPSNQPGWIADLVAYEAALLRTREPGGRVKVLLLRHNPRDLVQAALSEKNVVDVPRRYTFVVWSRFTKTSPTYRFRLRIPWL